MSGQLSSTLRGACIVAGLTLCFGLVDAAVDARVIVSGDRVLIEVDDVSIREVLEELARQTRLVVVSQEPLNEPLSVRIDTLPLPQAVRRLLRDKSFLLRQFNDGSAKLWILSENAGSRAQGWATPSDRMPQPEQGNALPDYLLLASSEEAGDREEAMYGFGDLREGKSIEYLLAGLSDPVESVREEAIQSLADLGGPASVTALATALHDPAASVRADAVDALGEIGGPAAVTWLQRAAADESAMVREAAADWLTEIAWTGY